MEMTQFSFPEMFSIGRILVWDEHYEGWFNLGPAQGLFSYEPDRRYRLEIDEDRMEELQQSPPTSWMIALLNCTGDEDVERFSCLPMFQPTRKLQVRGKESDRCITYLSRLSHLRTFDLSYSEDITGTTIKSLEESYTPSLD